MGSIQDSFVRIVIVDDEKKIITLLKKIIDWNGNNCSIVGEAYNGIDGLRLINEMKPEIVLSDINMPGKDGIEMMKNAQNDGIDSFYIFISGYSEFEYAKNALNFGAIGYILKPIDKIKVETLIQKAVEMIKVKKENRALKEIANQNVETYANGLYGNDSLYKFYSSEMESNLVNSIKSNLRNETDAILENIFTETKKNSLSSVQIKKLVLEIRASILKNFAKFDLPKHFEDSHLLFLAECDNADEIKKPLFSFIHEIMEIVSDYKKKSLKNAIEKAKIYITENINQEVSLSMVAKHVYMNPNYFSEFFKKETSQNFVDYVTKHKMNVAKDLLKNSSLKIEEISTMVGYENIQYFYKVFKKNEGVTPREYRMLKFW